MDQSKFENLSPIIHPAPVYPEEAQTEKIEGDATVQFDVDSQGNVAKLYESEPTLVFNEADLAATNKFSCVQASKNGQAVYVTNKKNGLTSN